MNILAIDTSCDETSVAVTNGTRVLSNVISSQIRYHKKFGGVVPFLAQRLHQERINAVIELGIARSGLGRNDIDAIAVTYGPGLAPALQVGVAKGKELAEELSLPLYAVNHMAGHIASCFAGGKNIEFPALGVLVSGGHTELVLMPRFGTFKILGETLDDAIGEAYDKVAKMLGLGYPGGRLVAQFADEGNSKSFDLPIPMLRSKDLNLSYSGLKNAVRLAIISVKGDSDEPLTREHIADICASFQYVAQASLLAKIEKSVVEYPEIKTVVVGGGVASNAVLRKKLRSLTAKYDLGIAFPVNAKLCTDNAAMIGIAAHLGIEEGQLPVADVEGLDRKPNLRLEKVGE